MELLAFIAFGLTLFFVYIFRNPERDVPFYQTNSLVAPCDGVVTSIEQLEDSEYAYRVDIESSYFNVGMLRVALNATVDSVRVVRGSRVAKSYIDLIEGQELMQTARYGLMINGFTSLYLPANFRLNLNVGQELRASETLVGYFS